MGAIGPPLGDAVGPALRTDYLEYGDAGNHYSRRKYASMNDAMNLDAHPKDDGPVGRLIPYRLRRGPGTPLPY
jgi:hypothetical protein